MWEAAQPERVLGFAASPDGGLRIVQCFARS